MPVSSFAARRHVARVVWHRTLIYLSDWAAFVLAGFLAFELRFDGLLPASYLQQMKVAVCIWTACNAVAFVVARLNRGNWRYTSAYDAARIVVTNSVSSFTSAIGIIVLLGRSGVPRSVFVLDWLIACLLTLGARLLTRVIMTSPALRRTEGTRTRTLIYGAGAAGLALLWEVRQNQSLMYDVVGLIDDDPSKVSLVLQGKRVLGTGDSLASVVRKRAIKKVLIAVPSATGPQMMRILKLVLEAGVEYKAVPGLSELIQGAELGKQIRAVAVGDLLGRKPVRLHLESIRAQIEGKVVMVTGAAGSIGSELCRQIAYFRPAALVGFDQAETPLFHLDRDLERNFPDLVFYPEIGSITRSDNLNRVMQRYRPSIVYHAAAYKHVPMMERHVFAAIENNIFGTWQVALAAAKNGVEDFVMISTDKAVRPTSMMGATKRVAELAIRALQKEHGTKYVVVRFGNVLGSNGSVVPIFKEQIAAGGPVTVTHPEMTRYFMTIPEAAQLVLQAFSFGRGGEVFVLDMGEPVKIADLAQNLILLSGLRPGRDIEIQFTGLRPGEKLFEELNLRDERLIPTAHPKIKSYVSNSGLDLKQVKGFLNELRQTVDERDVARLVLLLKALILDYNPGSDLLKAALQGKASRTLPGEAGTLSGQAESANPLAQAK